MKQQTLVKITYNQNVKHNRCSLLQHFFPSIFLTKYLLAKHKKKKRRVCYKYYCIQENITKVAFFLSCKKPALLEPAAALLLGRLSHFAKYVTGT